MKTYEEIEYTNVSLHFEHNQIKLLMNELVEANIPVLWRETKKFFTLSIQSSYGTQRLHFDKKGKYYRLRNRNYNLRDQRLSVILKRFIFAVKGHAIMKCMTKDSLVVQSIRYGEPVRIIQIKGPQKKILFEKECMVTMEQVIEVLKSREAEDRIPVLKLEIDYVLAELFEASQNLDQHAVARCKEKLEELRIEMLMLEI